MGVENIAAGGPVTSVGGALSGELGAVLPTDAVTAFDASWKRLGLVGNDGLSPAGERSIEEILDWGGDVIADLQSQHSSKFTYPLLEVHNVDVQKLVFGDANVTETAATTTSGKLISVTETGDPLEHKAFAWDMRHVNRKCRLVVPYGKITTVEEAPFVVAGLQMFTVTVTAYKDENGKKVYRYYDDGQFTAV